MVVQILQKTDANQRLDGEILLEETSTKDKEKRSRSGQDEHSDSDTGLTPVKEREEGRPPPPKAPSAPLRPPFLD